MRSVWFVIVFLLGCSQNEASVAETGEKKDGEWRCVQGKLSDLPITPERLFERIDNLTGYTTSDYQIARICKSPNEHLIALALTKRPKSLHRPLLLITKEGEVSVVPGQ